MKIVKNIIIVIVALIAIYMVLGILGPSSYKIERSIEINAPIDVVFDQTSIYANWDSWSPWSKLDPNAKYSIENDNQGVGATMSWEGNPDNVGTGTTYAGKALKTVHVGPYTNLKSTYDAFIAYIEANGYEINGNSWEEYIDDPTTIAPEELKTIIYFPVK